MKNKKILFLFLLIISISFSSCSLNNSKKLSENNSSNITSNLSRNNKKEKKPTGEPYLVGVTPDDYNMDYDTSRLKSLKEKKSKYYPKDGVKGIYFSAYAIENPKTYKKVINLVDKTKLNTLVVDVKDDFGNITCDFKSNDKDIKYATDKLINVENFINKMHKKGIYLIARISTFKDPVISERHPDWAFRLEDGSLLKNNNDEVFINPYMNEVRNYNLKIAELAAKAGFDEIQFDHVGFAEGFENFDADLTYSKGKWENIKMKEGDKRIDAITSFVKEAREMLQDYDTPCGIDVFGYSMQVGRAEGIGQDFKELSNQADVMSSIIYPSNWNLYSFDIEKPDLEPYELVKKYLKEEQKVFSEIDHKPQSRPWIQDFTASWLGIGNYMEYDAKAVEEQIRAIYDSGQDEFLLWNSNSKYTDGVEY
ncbi:MAG: putative glycoside hydrolase [Anaerococcus vaginalis]|nr:putative glycoside hydrolase [Anaerococcus vaginalis]